MNENILKYIFLKYLQLKFRVEKQVKKINKNSIEYFDVISVDFFN